MQQCNNNKHYYYKNMTLLKFSKIIINTKYLKEIRILDDKYHVFMIDNKYLFQKFNWGFKFNIVNLTTNHLYTEFCKKTNLQDYLILDEWINKNTSVK